MAQHPRWVTHAGAVAVFCAGCVVIAWTSLDIARSVRANHAPVTADQADQLRVYKRQLDAYQAARKGKGDRQEAPADEHAR